MKSIKENEGQYLGSRGTVNITTLPAMSMAQLQEKLKGPRQMGRS